MAKKKIKLSTKRFGPRYGPRLKNKNAQLEAAQRSKQTCPYCKKQGVKRLSLGIWHCRKCGRKFTGKAYTIQEQAPEEAVEEA